MPRAPSRSGQLRRQQAIDTLLELASERPPSQIRTAQISERMGLSEAALFRHFPSKESLWLATLEHAIARAWQQIDTLLQSRGAQTRPLEALRELLRLQFSINRTLPGLPPLIFHELQNRSPGACRGVVINHLERLQQQLEALVGLAQQHHELSPDVSSGGLAGTLLALLLGFLLQEQIRGADPGEAEAQLEASLNQVLLPHRRPG
jgi:TetR/AcrR family transcriptional regulator